MKEKRFIVEMYIAGENKVTYIVRELPAVPNQPAQFVGSFDSADDLIQFFSNLEND